MTSSSESTDGDGLLGETPSREREFRPRRECLAVSREVASSNRQSDHWTRRAFVRTAGLASAGSLLGLRESVAAEPALETRTLRIVQAPGICFAPQYVVEELLRAEGFSDVQYVATALGGAFELHLLGSSIG